MHADKWEKAQCTWGTEKRPAWLESVGSNMVYPQSPVLSSFYLFSFQVFKIEAYFTKIKYLHCNIGQWVLTTANTQVNHHQIKIQCFLLFKKLPNIPFPKFLPPQTLGGHCSDSCYPDLSRLFLESCSVHLSFYVVFFRYICVVPTAPTWVMVFCWVCRSKWKS